MTQQTVPVAHDDPTNHRILEVSEDQVQGFWAQPFHRIAEQADLDVSVVIERIRAMLDAGVIRRVRQTLLATNLAPGALVAWETDDDRLNETFDWMFANDPFTGHVVIRTTDATTPAAKYKLWTTLKVPVGYSREKHCQLLCQRTGAKRFITMPAKRLFALGVGHTRRQRLEPGDKSPDLAQVRDTKIVELNALDWKVLVALKRELAIDEITEEPWTARAKEAGVKEAKFLEVAQSLNERGVIGRFSTFLEHAKPNATGGRVTRFNGLFHWAVPPGREIEAGRQIGRFHVLTHAYWREGGPEFHNVNVMAVAHGMEKARVLAHKAAIDQHLATLDIPIAYTNVFWGGRSEIKPSEISPIAYEAWCGEMNVDPADMRDSVAAGAMSAKAAKLAKPAKPAKSAPAAPGRNP